MDRDGQVPAAGTIATRQRTNAERVAALWENERGVRNGLLAEMGQCFAKSYVGRLPDCWLD